MATIAWDFSFKLLSKPNPDQIRKALQPTLSAQNKVCLTDRVDVSIVAIYYMGYIKDYKIIGIP